MRIMLSEREVNHLEQALNVLNKYSRMYSAMVKGEQGMHHDTAASAAGMIESIITANTVKELVQEA